MPGLFTEATRVQLTAIQHLARIGYTYLGKISESGAVLVSANSKGAPSATSANIAFDPETNILVDIFAEQFKKLNPAATVSAQSVLSDIQKELDDDDLGQQFYRRLTSYSPLRLVDFEHPENNTYHSRRNSLARMAMKVSAPTLRCSSTGFRSCLSRSRSRTT